MDALLWELLLEGSPDDQVEVLIRLGELKEIPENIIGVVAQLGSILSCRIRRGDIVLIHDNEAVFSMKAQRILYLDPPLDEHYFTIPNDSQFQNINRKRPETQLTGRGVVMGITDWGFDFTHPNFRKPNGSTRFLTIWDQGGDYDGVNEYGFGSIYSRSDINKALQTEAPFLSLKYHPGKTDLYQQGMHGTCVTDIAAGNGAVGTTGIAPEADLVAVHLSTDRFNDLINLGSSVRVFDALHFINSVAGSKPLVINMSVGSHGDAHTGLSLIEQAIDYIVTSTSNRAVVQSCGNYFASRIHTDGYFSSENVQLEWLISNLDRTPNEIEVWYGPSDEIQCSLLSPGGDFLFKNKSVGKSNILNSDGSEIGRYYHRENEPNSGLNQVFIVLNENAESGKWNLILTPVKISNGLFHAWIERDHGSLLNQSRFTQEQATNNTTTGSICNGFYNISVGAINTTGDGNNIAFFSSSGPTWDGRQKPDLTAPGVGIRAAKSAAPFENFSTGELTCKTGTSMAAPVVAGAICLLYSASDRPLTIKEVKKRLQEACDLPQTEVPFVKQRFGSGILNLEKLFQFTSSPVSIIHNNEIINQTMNNLQLSSVQMDRLIESYREQFPELYGDDLCGYFESLPFDKSVPLSYDLRSGDILIRRQYAHHDRVWYGIVVFVHDQQAFVLDKKNKIKIISLNGDKGGDWEIKKLRINYETRNRDDVQEEQYIEDAEINSEDFKIRGDVSSNVLLEWIADKASKNRVYYVTSGGNGAWNSPIMFVIKQKNNGTRYIRSSGWAIALRLMGQQQAGEFVHLTGQEVLQGNFKKVEQKTKIDPGAENLFTIRVSLADINNAYKRLNLNDPRMQLETQFFWSERVNSSIKFFYTRLYCNFYLVNPIEFVYTDEIIFVDPEFRDKSNVGFVNVIVNGVRKKIKYPEKFNFIKTLFPIQTGVDAKFEISTTKAEVDTNTNQVNISLSASKSDSRGQKDSVKNINTASFKINNDFLEAGFESSLELGSEFETIKTVSNDLTKSFLNSQTIQNSFSTEIKYSLSIPYSKYTTMIVMKPIFKPVAVKIIRFEDIDRNGIAKKRVEATKSSIVWVNTTYHFYQQVQKPRR